MQDTDDAQDWLTVKEAAQLLHMTHGGTCNLLLAGGLKGEKVGKRWRIARSEVARKLAEDAPRGYFVRQHADAVELAGGRVFRMPDAGGEV
jgi:excisionase family DNA binding protein